MDNSFSLRRPIEFIGQGWNVRSDAEQVIVSLIGDWIARDEVHVEVGSIQKILDVAANRAISFDCSELGHWDSALLLFVSELRDASQERHISLQDDGLPGAATRLLALLHEARPLARKNVRKNSLITRVGQATIDGWNEIGAATTLVGETVLSGGTAARGRLRMRGGDLLACVYDAGVAALPIVTIVNVLIGGIVAFVGSVQLERFGAGIFVADLVGVAMVREMVALMTSIVMSGRTGGAYAAQIAAMQENEEIDALRVIGIPVFDYLILPRILALTGMMPLLYLYGCAIGIFGGFLVAVAMLNISPAAFIAETRVSLAWGQIVFGLVKSIAFGGLIAIVGCRAGLSAGRGAADVGRAATSAVVLSIVGVIALDAVFAICANALDF